MVCSKEGDAWLHEQGNVVVSKGKKEGQHVVATGVQSDGSPCALVYGHQGMLNENIANPWGPFP